VRDGESRLADSSQRAGARHGVPDGSLTPSASLRAAGSSAPRHRYTRVAGLALAAVVLVALAIVATASGSKELVGSFGSTSGSGSLGGQFNNPRGVGTNKTGVGGVPAGTIYVADENNHRIQRFNAGGEFVAAWGANVLTAPSNEVQTLTVSATAGTFTLTFEGATTGALPFNASPGQVQTALRALAPIGGTNVNVNGNAPYFFSFNNALQATNVGQLSADTTLLTGTATPATTTQGSGQYEICTVAANCRAGTPTGGANAANTAKNGSLNSPQALAVDDDTGNVYVSDRDNFRVNEYSATGNFIRSFGSDVDATEAATTYEVCPAADRCKFGAPGAGAGQIGESFGDGGSHGIAVSSPDGNASTGSVFLADAVNRRVNTYDLDGANPSSFGSAAVFGSGQPREIAVDSRGIVYIGGSSGNIERYDSQNANGGGAVFMDPITSWINEYQGVNLSGFSTGDTFTLTCPNGETTAPIAFNSTSATFQSNLTAALDAKCGAGISPNVNGATNPTFKFVGAFGKKDVPTMTCTVVNGTGSCSVSVFEDGRPGALLPPGNTFLTTAGIAVDPDTDAGGPDADALYVLRVPGLGFGNTVVQQIGPGNAPGLTAAPTESDDTHGNGLGFPGEGFSGSQALGLGLDYVSGRAFISAISNVGGFSGSGHRVYILDTVSPPTPAINGITPDTTGATIAGTVNPNGPPSNTPNPVTTSYQFEFKKSSDSTWIPYQAPRLSGSGVSPIPLSLRIGGLDPNTDYDVRLVATKQSGGGTATSAPQTFHTVPAPPAIDSVWSTGVQATSADLHAKINPRGSDTSYHFEYGTTTEYGQHTPETNIGSSSTLQSVQDHLSGLTPVVYHFRLIASNSHGTTTGEDETFNFYPEPCPNEALRQQSGSAFLPDCRSYELVSPANAGQVVLVPGGPQRPYASDPSRLAFVGTIGEIPDSGGKPADYIGDLYVASRSPSGWTTKYVGPPGDEVSCAGGRPQMIGRALAPTVQNDVMADPGLDRVIDWNLGHNWMCFSWLGPGQDTSRASLIGSNAPYMWNTGDGSFADRLPTSVADVPGSYENFLCPQDPAVHPFPYGVESVNVSAFCSTYVSASGDLDHFVFSTQEDIYGGGPDALDSAPGSVYDNDVADNTLSLVSLAPGGGPILQESPKNGGEEERIQLPFISEDGSHILMGTQTKEQCRSLNIIQTACPAIPKQMHLYMRVNNTITYDVSGGAPVDFLDSTSDGRKVYFSTDQQLLPAEDTDQSVDIYMWSDVGVPGLTLVSRGSSGSGNSDSCEASWVDNCDIEPYSDSGISFATGNRGGLNANGMNPDLFNQEFSEDSGGYTDNSLAANGDLVFYSPELLDGGKGLPGAVNVYLYREGAPRFIATLDDDPYCIEPEFADTYNNTGPACSDGPLGRLQVTPNGRYVAFVTTTQLTSYDNHGYAMMYRYDADTGDIVCVSCNPEGLPPAADVEASQGGRFISDDGRVFFHTADSLVPTDTNAGFRELFLLGEIYKQVAGYDVYEYTEGRARLISSGTSVSGSALLLASASKPGLYGVSADGVDVYFGTTDPLVPQDQNGGGNLRFYDARTNGGFQYNPPPPPCEAADECHGTPSQPPAPLANGTGAALGDGGNVRPAAKKQKRRRARNQRGSNRHRHGKKAGGQRARGANNQRSGGSR
jgi:hypothetical protein